MHPSMSSVLDTSFPDMPNPILLHAAACEFSKAKVNRSGGQEFRANLTVTCFDGKRFTRYYAAQGVILWENKCPMVVGVVTTYHLSFAMDFSKSTSTACNI